MTGSDRRALITGSSGNLGRIICESFLQDGYSVVGVDVAQPMLSMNGIAPATPEGGVRGDWRFVACDLGDPASVKEALADAHAQGPFDIVVNNAGVIYNSPLLRFEGGQLLMHDTDAWKLVLSGTLSSTFYVSAHCAREMLAAGKAGTIINISSICAVGNVGQAAYSAAKAGVNAMTVSLSKELGPMGIRVAAIAPGFFDTESTRRSLSKDALSRIRKAIPLQKLGEPSQLYHAIRFIADNGYFHGKVLELDGGLTL